MHPGIIFAVTAAFAFGIWTLFHDQASNYIDYLFGAIIVSLTSNLLEIINNNKIPANDPIKEILSSVFSFIT